MTSYTTRPTMRVKTDLKCRLLAPELEPGHSCPITAKLVWSTAVPELVTATIAASGGVVEWDLSRELLEAGCRGPAGLGDVSVLPRPDRPDTAELVLCNGKSTAALLFTLAALEKFLALIDAQRCPNGCDRENRDGRLVCIRHEVSDIPPAERFLTQP